MCEIVVKIIRSNPNFKFSKPKNSLVKIAAVLIFGLLSTPFAVFPADGEVDRIFKTDITENNGTINAVKIQPDGKILVGGFFEAFGGRARRGIARLNADGTLDESFDPIAAIPNANATVRAIDIQADGRIVVGISYDAPGAMPRKLVARLLPDGTSDPTFDCQLVTRPFVADGAYAVAIDNSGGIIVGGTFRYSNDARRDLARLNPDGSIDTFNQPTNSNGAETVRAIHLFSDGTFLAGGSNFTYPSGSRQVLARFNANGTLDTTYGNNSVQIAGSVTNLVAQPDGSVIAGGTISFSPPIPAQTFTIVKFDANRVRDASFSINFSSGGIINGIARQADGKLIIVGDFQFTTPAIRSNIARLNADGTLDATFNTSGSIGSRRAINAVAIQADGKVFTAGAFDNFNGSTAEDYIRLNTDGSRDSSLAANSVGYNGCVNAMLRQSDGKLLLGIGGETGNQTKVNGIRQNGIVRFNKNYDVDPTFNSALTRSSAVQNLTLQTDGKILVSGNLFFNANSFTLLRLNANGSVDTGFNPPLNLRIPVVQADGKIITAGNGEIVRLNSDGSRDNSFTAVFNGSNFVNAIVLQADGKILVGGMFTSINNIARTNIVRLNSNGTVDTNFDPGTSANATINAILVRNDGRIFIGGAFTNFAGTPRSGVALLEANGNLSGSFIPANPSALQVSTLALQTGRQTADRRRTASFRQPRRLQIERGRQSGQLFRARLDGKSSDSTDDLAADEP